MDITGVRVVIRAIEKKREETKQQMAPAMKACADVVLRKALKYCPKDTGALRKSGVASVSGTGWASRAVVAFGGETAHYAIYVHEDLSKYHEPPTQAKFLERAYRETKGVQTNILKRATTGKMQAIVNDEVEDR